MAAAFSMPTRIVFGAGRADDSGELARELGARRAFLVTDPGIVRAGHAARVERALRGAGLDVRSFDRVRENPTSADVDACRAALGDWNADLLVAVGGGSSIDVAKGCNFLRAGGGRMQDYHGVGKGKGAFLPLIAIPTTAGTGSEVQSFALIEQDGTHRKMACGDARAAPAIALLDPTLSMTQPRDVTACTGLDTLAHAVETAVTTKRTPMSSAFSLAAFVAVQADLPRVLAAPDDLVARGRMLLAATNAGIAIENSMLGAAHSMANPLTARYPLAHGLAVALVLPHVVRFNAAEPTAAAAYAALATAAGLCAADAAVAAAVDALVARLEQLLEDTGFARSLAAHGVSASAVGELAEDAATQWTAQFNPRAVGAAEFRVLFAAALG